MTERGRPTARRSIVENVILPANLVDTHMKLRDLHQVTIDTDRTINCLAEHGLVSNEQVSCKQSMGFLRRAKYSDGRAWYCKRCKSFRSIRVNSFFADSRLTLSKILQFMYWWSEINCQLSVVKDQVNIAWEGAVNW